MNPLTILSTPIGKQILFIASTIFLHIAKKTIDEQFKKRRLEKYENY